MRCQRDDDVKTKLIFVAVVSAGFLAGVLSSAMAQETTGATNSSRHTHQAVQGGVAPPQNNLMEAEAAPPPVNVTVPAGSMLQAFSSQRDADASAKAAAALGLVKAQQDLENVTRESEAKAREAQTIRNQAGASALMQRQQDVANVAAQQSTGSFGRVVGDGLTQGIQQGAQSAGQALGGVAGGRVTTAGAQLISGGGPPAGGAAGDMAPGPAASGASAAGGQIFSGAGASTPATAGAPVGGTAAAASTTPALAADASALGTGSSKRYIGPPIAEAKVIHDRKSPTQLRGVFDAVCPKHGKYGGELGKVTGCPLCEAEKHQVWDALCPVHGKYGGQGPVNGCPKCADEAKHWMPRNGLR